MWHSLSSVFHFLLEQVKTINRLDLYVPLVKKFLCFVKQMTIIPSILFFKARRDER